MPHSPLSKFVTGGDGLTSTANLSSPRQVVRYKQIIQTDTHLCGVSSHVNLNLFRLLPTEMPAESVGRPAAQVPQFWQLRRGHQTSNYSNGRAGREMANGFSPRQQQQLVTLTAATVVNATNPSAIFYPTGSLLILKKKEKKKKRNWIIILRMTFNNIRNTSQ